MSGNAYNPYNRQQQPQILGSGYQTQPAYYSPSVGVGANAGYQTQPKSYEGGNVYGNPGYQAGRPQYQNQGQYLGMGPAQGQPLETYDGDVHYHPAQNEDFCCSLGCLLGFDLVLLLGLIFLFINNALNSWGWWFAVVFVVAMVGLNIYLLIVACGTNRTNGTKSAFNAYHVLRIILGVCVILLAIIFFIVAIIFWTSAPKTGDSGFDAAVGKVASVFAWVFFIYFLVYFGISLYFLITIGAFRRAIDRNHTNGSSLPY